MIPIACVDPANGLMFNDRRQSRDSAVIQTIAKIVRQAPLWVTKYSLPLFSAATSLNVADVYYPAAKADRGEFCFLEDAVEMLLVPDILESVEGIILFRWDKSYPADEFFPINILEGKSLVYTTSFAGKSHDQITLEVYKF